MRQELLQPGRKCPLQLLNIFCVTSTAISMWLLSACLICICISVLSRKQKRKMQGNPILNQLQGICKVFPTFTYTILQPGLLYDLSHDNPCLDSIPARDLHGYLEFSFFTFLLNMSIESAYQLGTWKAISKSLFCK